MRVLTFLLTLLAAGSLTSPAAAQLLPAFGDDRAGTAGFQFLEVPVDPRGAALGGAAVTSATDASALFWNPALAARAGEREVAASHLRYYAGSAMSYAAGLTEAGAFTLGAHVQAFTSGDMDVTTEFSGPAGTGETFSFTALAVGLSAGQSLTEQFSYGLTAKYAREAAAGVTTQTALLDLGVAYTVGTTGVDLGVAIRNFGLNGTPQGEIPREVIGDGEVIEDEFEGYVPPTTLQMGASYRPFREMDGHDLVLTGQVTNPNDNAEQFNVGAEYIWNDLLVTRVGYRLGAEERSLPSFGFGLNVDDVAGVAPGTRLRLDYGFARMDRLGSTHRVGVNVRFQ